MEDGLGFSYLQMMPCFDFWMVMRSSRLSRLSVSRLLFRVLVILLLLLVCLNNPNQNKGDEQGVEQKGQSGKEGLK